MEITFICIRQITSNITIAVYIPTRNFFKGMCNEATYTKIVPFITSVLILASEGEISHFLFFS